MAAMMEVSVSDDTRKARRDNFGAVCAVDLQKGAIVFLLRQYTRGGCKVVPKILCSNHCKTGNYENMDINLSLNDENN